MRRSRVMAAGLVALSSVCCAQAQTPAPAAPPAAAASAKPLALDSRSLPLGGALKNALPVWAAYKTRFITDRGRLTDTANAMISHSEGQGYAMLLAVAANDRPTFERVWGWTRANLMVRDDELLAWRWDPAARPAVSDMNDASDGDILVAWALTEAAELWADNAYRAAGRRIAVEVGRKLLLSKTKLGTLLLPAVAGFSGEDREDGPVVNPSYWVFPALARLPLVAPEVDWSGLTQGGLDLLKSARFGSTGLPSEWVSARDGAVKPADGFPTQFGYNAVRIPLYLAWAGVGEREHYAPFVAWAQRGRGRPALVDVKSGRDVQGFSEWGYGAVAAVTLCAAEQQRWPAELRQIRVEENYYPATLHMLALIAVEMRYQACLRS